MRHQTVVRVENSVKCTFLLCIIICSFSVEISSKELVFLRSVWTLHLKTVCCNPDPKKQVTSKLFYLFNNTKEATVLLAFNDSYLYPDCTTVSTMIVYLYACVSWKHNLWSPEKNACPEMKENPYLLLYFTGFLLGRLWVPFILLHVHSVADDHVASSRCWVAMKELQIGAYLVEWIPTNFKAEFCNNFTGLKSKLSVNYQFDMQINIFGVGKIQLVYLI